MENKKIVKIKDDISSHDCSVFPDTNNLIFIRNQIENGDIEILDDDIVVYTDTSLHKAIDIKSKKKIALMIESPEIHKQYYEYIEQNNKLFDMVLTFSKKLLDKGENYKFNVYGTTWIHETYRNIYTKSKFCSLILSNKMQTSGHVLRHNIASILINTNIDMYGAGYKPLPHLTTRNFDKDHCGAGISNQKILGLKDYMFSIVIENCKEDYYFTEKLVDCFLTGTIPIYYGCPSIHKFFNGNGILSFTTVDECIQILNTLSDKIYNELLPYVKENFEIAKRYTLFTIDETHILDII
jgi:hypothetical protein